MREASQFDRSVPSTHKRTTCSEFALDIAHPYGPCGTPPTVQMPIPFRFRRQSQLTTGKSVLALDSGAPPDLWSVPTRMFVRYLAAHCSHHGLPMQNSVALCLLHRPPFPSSPTLSPRTRTCRRFPPPLPLLELRVPCPVFPLSPHSLPPSVAPMAQAGPLAVAMTHSATTAWPLAVASAAHWFGSHGQPLARAHYSTAKYPPVAAHAHVSSSHGQPLERVHCNTAKCPFIAAHAHAHSPHGQPLAQAHCSTAKCPPLAAHVLADSSHGQPLARAHCSTAKCPYLAATAHVCTLHGQPFA
jgi:hypothetical protein